MSQCNDGRFSYVKPEDKVVRLLAESIPMELTVTKIEDGIIHTVGGWTFSVANGAEIDEDLDWNEEMTGSRLLTDEEARERGLKDSVIWRSL